MSQRDMCFGERPRERDNIGLISFGIFLVLVGVVFLLTPNLPSAIERFFGDFHLVQVGENIFLPAPYRTHPVVYLAVAEFGLLFGPTQVVLLLVEYAQGRSIHRKAETAYNIVFWFGVGYLAYSLSIGSLAWFESWAALIVVVGISIIVRAVIVASQPKPPLA